MRRRCVPISMMVVALMAVACGDDTDTSDTTVDAVTTSTSTSVPASTTTVASTTTGSVAPTTLAPTSTSQPSIDDVVLAADGLGVVDFGDEAEAALAVLVEILGEPDSDTGWADPSVEANEPLWPGCPGSLARTATWHAVVGVVFTDWDPSSDDRRATLDTPYLAGAGMGAGSPVTTPDGARSGDTLGELRAIYGDRLWISPQPDEAVGLRHFSIDDETHPGPLHRTGGLRGWILPPGDPDGSPTASTVAPESAAVTDDYVAAGFIAGVSCSSP